MSSVSITKGAASSNSSGKPAITQISGSRRGAWLVNMGKHLLRVDRTDPGLQMFEHTLFSGQCGSLLIKLSGDQEETVSKRKLVAHARASGIEQPILQVYLDVIRCEGAIDWDTESKEYRVLAQSRHRVLRIVDKVFRESIDLGSERHAPEILEYCLSRPRFTTEILDALSNEAKENELKELLAALGRFHVLGTKVIAGKTLYFNAYQFGTKAEQIGRALDAFSGQERRELDDLLCEVRQTPGVPLKRIKVGERIIKMAVGLGLVDKNIVPSAAGAEEFLTAPLFAPPSVGEETEHLEDDVFNHAKILLSSLRYGEIYSIDLLQNKF